MTRTRPTPLQMTPTKAEREKVRQIKQALRFRYDAEVMHLVLAEFDLNAFLASRSVCSIVQSAEHEEAAPLVQSEAA